MARIRRVPIVRTHDKRGERRVIGRPVGRETWIVWHIKIPANVYTLLAHERRETHETWAERGRKRFSASCLPLAVYRCELSAMALPLAMRR